MEAPGTGQKNIRDAFERIAPSWYSVRHWTRFQRELEELAHKWQRGRLLNIGCAHGPDFLPFCREFELWGIDFSHEMIRQAHRYACKHHLDLNLIVADARSLPFEDCCFDNVIAVAVYHHITDKEGRKQAFSELFRVLKPEGEAFLTVWNRWQPNFWFHGKETLVPWKLKDETVQRYYYLFSYRELKRLAESTGFRVIRIFPEKSFRFPLKLFSRNICLLLMKPNEITPVVSRRIICPRFFGK